MGPCGNEGANAHCHCARFIQRLDVLQFITQVTVFLPRAASVDKFHFRNTFNCAVGSCTYKVMFPRIRP